MASMVPMSSNFTLPNRSQYKTVIYGFRHSADPLSGPNEAVGPRLSVTETDKYEKHIYSNAKKNLTMVSHAGRDQWNGMQPRPSPLPRV